MKYIIAHIYIHCWQNIYLYNRKSFFTFAHRKMPIDFVIQYGLLWTLQRLLREISNGFLEA